MAIFQHRNVAIVLLVYCFTGITFFTTLLFTPVYFILVENASATMAEVYLIPYLVPLTISSISMGLIISKWIYLQVATFLIIVGRGLLRCTVATRVRQHNYWAA